MSHSLGHVEELLVVFDDAATEQGHGKLDSAAVVLLEHSVAHLSHYSLVLKKAADDQLVNRHVGNYVDHSDFGVSAPLNVVEDVGPQV